ncbi:MAG: hypothetical protein L6R36_009013, partial [Xanthoria steineri]
KSELQSLVELIKDLRIPDSLYFLIPWCLRGDIELLALNRSVNVAIRLWLMVNTQELKCEGFRHETDSVQRDDDRMVREFLQSPFPSAKWQLTAQSSSLEPHFIAAFMRDVCGLRMEWTASLDDRLRLDKKAKSRVFPFRCYLQALIDRHHSNSDRKRYASNSFDPLAETKRSVGFQSRKKS